MITDVSIRVMIVMAITMHTNCLNVLRLKFIQLFPVPGSVMG